MPSQSKKATSTVDEDFVKSKMVTADRVYHRLLWDDRIPVADFDLGYEDRFKGILFLPITRFRHTGDETSEIPFHRVHLFRYKGEIIWDRDNRIDRIDKFFERFGTTTSDDDAAASSSLLRSTMSGTADGVRISRPDKNRRTVKDEEEDEQAADEEQDDGTVELRVVTFNVLFDRFQAEKIYTDWRIPLIARELEGQNADIIGLQEVTEDFYGKLRRASELLRRNYYWTAVPSDVPSCQIILSRYPLTECVSVSLSKNKRAIFAVVEVSSMPIVVCNCHLVSDFGGGTEVAVGRRVEELKTILTRLSPYPSCVLLGDFNFGDQSPEMRSAPIAPFVDTYLETRHSHANEVEEQHQLVHTTGVILSEDETNPEAVALRENRSVGGYTFDVVHNDLALLCSQFHMYPRRLDRILVKGLQPLATSLFGQTPSKTVVPVRLPKALHAEEEGKKHGRGTAPPKGTKRGEEREVDEPYVTPVVKGPTKEMLLFPSDHYGVSCLVAFDANAVAEVAAAAPVVPLPLPATSFPPFVPCFQTALCIIPPEGPLHTRINAIREVYDRGYPRWMPHINVLHPFVTPDRMPDAIELVESILASVTAASPGLVTIALNQLSFFEARKRLVFLLPECDDGGAKLDTLHRLLQDAFPHCRKEKVDEQGYHPHLTLGQVDGKGQFTALERLFNDTWETPTAMPLTELCMVGLLEGADQYVVLHRFAVPATTDAANPATEQHGQPGAHEASSCSASPTAMVMEVPAWGTRALRPYTPEDALERWMLCATNPVYARDAPTHISQRGAMYHIPSHLIDTYLVEWAKSYEAASVGEGAEEEEKRKAIPFYMEEVRGSVFRLYVDLDIKSTQTHRIDATELIPYIASVAAELFHLTQGTGSEDDKDDTQLLSMECHGPWTDQLHPDAQFKSGYRLYFQRVFVDAPTLSRFLEELGRRLEGSALARSILMNAETTPHGMKWEEVCDTKAATWDRGRLVGTIKRRRNLQRRYSFHGLFNAQGAVSSAFLLGDLRRILYGTTLRVWETVPTDGVAMDNAFDPTRFKTLA